MSLAVGLLFVNTDKFLRLESITFKEYLSLVAFE